MEKGGELTSFYVITSVLALVGFLILIWFVVRIGIDNEAETQVCHLSVITRATALEAAQQFVPLHCTTQKVCLKEGAGTCETSFAGEHIREIKVDKRTDETGTREAIRAVEATLAEEMYSCWSMMGEGKLDLFQSLQKKTGLESVKSTCVICSRVAIDVAAGREAQILREVNLPAYLKSHTVPNSQLTYLQAFTDPSVQAYSKVSEDILAKEFSRESALEVKPKTPEYAVVFMQIKPTSLSDAIKNIGSVATVAGGAFVLTPMPLKGGALRTAASGLFTLPGAVVAASGAVIGGAIIYSNTDQGAGAAAGYCGDVTVPGAATVKASSTGADVRKGCSMVQVVAYDAVAINSLCNHIESAP